ncbi:WD40 repeat domain-containing protein [Streptacidiphilus rugosus]|uniref:WD40 repeat domain-containing protein n=1 Tax=Streptacidiphilus rugosus TaxID=405783 RepID=UPI000B0895E9|nr:WD40 repeat domain-containing protein [Streptacidiphilus rugosus]
MSGDLQSGGQDREVAAAGGRLSDPGWLVSGDPEQVLAALDGASGQEELTAAAVYRTSGHVHREAGATVRRQVLAVDAARHGDRELASSIAEAAVGQEADEPWVVQWATGSGLDSRLRYSLPTPDKVSALATVVAGGRALAVAGCEDGTLAWWDLVTGRRLGQVATERRGAVRALATAVLEGRPVAVTSGPEGAVRVWDLVAGEALGAFHTDDDSWVKSLATGLVGGRPVVVGAGVDDVLLVWDLAALTRHGEPLTIRTGSVCALATAVLGGRTVAVTSHSRELGATDLITGEETLRLWDLVTGREVGPLGDPSRWSPDFADQQSGRTAAAGEDEDEEGAGVHCVSLNLNAEAKFLVTDPAAPECPMAVSVNAYEVHVWNLLTGGQSREPVPGRSAETAAVGVLQGRPTVLLGGPGSVQVLDLSTLTPRCPPLTGHLRTVRGTAMAAVKGRHLAVTGSDDRSVRIWDLDADPETGTRPTGPAEHVRAFTTAVVNGRCVLVTADSDQNVRIRSLDDGGQLEAPLPGATGHVDLLTVGTVEGRPRLLTRDVDRTVRIWDLATREELHGRTTREYTLTGIRFFGVVEGGFVGVTWEGRVWDLTANGWTGVQPKQDRARALGLEAVEGRDLLLATSRTHAVRLWDLATGEPVGEPLTGHTDEVWSASTAVLDGRLVAATGGDDRTVRWWDVTTGQQLGQYAFPAGIWQLAGAPDGRVVVGSGRHIAVLAPR